MKIFSFIIFHQELQWFWEYPCVNWRCHLFWLSYEETIYNCRCIHIPRYTVKDNCFQKSTSHNGKSNTWMLLLYRMFKQLPSHPVFWQRLLAKLQEIFTICKLWLLTESGPYVAHFRLPSRSEMNTGCLEYGNHMSIRHS